MGQLWGTEGQKGAVGQSLGRRQGHRTTGKGTRGGAVGHTGRGLRGRKALGDAMGQDEKLHPQEFGPPAARRAPSAHATFIGHGAMGHYSKGGMQQPPPPPAGAGTFLLLTP